MSKVAFVTGGWLFSVSKVFGRVSAKPCGEWEGDTSLTRSKAIGTLRSEDGDGSENVAEKVNSRSFNLHLDYSKSITLSNVGEPS